MGVRSREFPEFLTLDSNSTSDDESDWLKIEQDMVELRTCKDETSLQTSPVLSIGINNMSSDQS